MSFKDLSGYFKKMENTSSRLLLIDILAQLFSRVEVNEVDKVAYLTQGRVGPFFEALEIGMSDKLVAQAIARAFGADKQQVLKDYGRVGDLGKVASQYASRSQKLQKSPLTVTEVFNDLRQIAQYSGEGTVDKKISSLAGLLEKVSADEAKYLVRIPLGVTRLGIGDPTVLDAFAALKLGDKSKRGVLEAAYNKVSDLGLIGQVLWKNGLSGIKKLSVRVGKPLRSQLCERISDPKTILEKYGGRAHVQYKFDGFRVQIHKEGDSIKLFSRNLEETTQMFPEIVKAAVKQVKAHSAILDSEALAFNPESDEFLPFQETTKRRRKYGIEEMQKKLPLKAFVFDIMYLNGKSLIELPLSQRMEKLQVLEGDEVLIKQSGEFVEDPQRLQQLFEDALSKGLEGVVTKRPDSLYEAGARNFNWIKLKRHSSGSSAGGMKDTLDCVILGYVFGRGKRAEFGAGALLVGVYDKANDQFVTVSKIGTGLTDKEWREVHKRADKIKVSKKPARVYSQLQPSVWIKPEIVIEVMADEITRSPVHTAGKKEGAGYALRFPRLVKFRDDKSAEDATTVDELVTMHQQQYIKS